MARSSHRLIALFVALAVAGCGNGAGTLPAGTAGDGSIAGPDTSRVPVAIRIVVPARRHDRGARYLSPSTKGMTITLTGPSKVNEIVGLTPSSPGCSKKNGLTTCEFVFKLAPCPPKKQCYGGAVTTYDQVACAPKCTIPAGAHVLSANQSLAFSVRRGKRNTIRLTLDGVPASLAVMPAPGSTLSGDWSTGFTASKCITARQNVAVVGYDVDKNQIVGPGAPWSALASDDKIHLAVATPGPSASPSAFELVPPSTLTAGSTIPNAGTVVHLTATVTPRHGSGATLAVTGHSTVTFNTDICGVVSEFAVPTKGGPDNLAISGNIAPGPDGNLWFTEQCTSMIGKITTNGAITEYGGMTASSFPNGIVTGPGSKMWFTENGGHHTMGTITMDGTIHEYSSPNINNGGDAVLGPNGLVWFSDSGNNSIGMITTDGASVLEYTVPTTNAGPTGITTGADGNLWFTEINKSRIGRSTTNASMSDTPTITPSAAPYVITSGPDGALWFTEAYTAKVGRITTGGTIHEYPVSGANVSDQLVGITTGPDGALWFTENSSGGTGKIWRITPAGAITKFSSTFVAFGEAGRITTGPDGALWFTLLNYIGRMQ